MKRTKFNQGKIYFMIFSPEKCRIITFLVTSFIRFVIFSLYLPLWVRAETMTCTL